jgi:superfamily II DNA or RNA helicase
LTISLRPYQNEAVESVFDFYSKPRELDATGKPKRKNALLCLPTGTGKSLIIGELARRMFERVPNTRLVMSTHVKELIRNNAEKLQDIWPMAPLGIYSAGLKSADSGMPIVFGGIQSMVGKYPKFGSRDFLFVDEAHLVGNEGSYLKFINELEQTNPFLKIVGLSATPYRLGMGCLTNGKLFTDIIYDITDQKGFQKLIADGYLCPLISKPGNLQIDTSNVGLDSKGEFIAGEVHKAIKEQAKTREQLTEFVTYGENRKSWIVFAAGIEEAEEINDLLNNVFSISSVVLHSKMPTAHNDGALKAWKNGDVRCAVNMNMLCLDSRTEILTSDGWTGMEQMTYQHEVACWTEQETFFAPPKFIVKRDLEPHEKMVSLESRNHNVRVTSNHRMLWSWKKENFKITSAESIVEKKGYMPVSGSAAPFDVQTSLTSEKTYKHRLACLSHKYRKQGMNKEAANALAQEHQNHIKKNEFLEPSLLSNDMCAFIGFWLGDGTSHGGRYSISQSARYVKIVKWIDDLLMRLQLHYVKTKSVATKSEYEQLRWNLSTGKGGKYQKREGGVAPIISYLKKDGSNLLWALSKEQFLSLLNGYWLADGGHGDGETNSVQGNCIFGTNKKLFDLLQAIAACRGIRASIFTKKSQNGWKPINNFTWKEQTASQVVSERFVLETEKQAEKVWCVTSETGNIITRRKGKVTVMGNTTGVDNPMLDYCGDFQPTTSTAKHVQKNGRLTRPFPGKANGLVMDYAGNFRRLGPIDDPVIPKMRGKGPAGDAPIKICKKEQGGCGFYNHASARYCGGKPYPSNEGCGREFIFQDKTTFQAFSGDAMRSDAPLIEAIKVDRVIYTAHVSKAVKAANPGALHSTLPISVKVSYYCGLRTYYEWVTVEGLGGRVRGRDWFRQRFAGEPPSTNTEVLALASQLRKPETIKVWMNANPQPKVMSAEF